MLPASPQELIDPGSLEDVDIVHDAFDIHRDHILGMLHRLLIT
jgi:hypothetical protein